uniref:Uncharacterized protein n=1 Tax=Solanum tuberosum TaxID=4113 RepID=M0ZL93_SOLTU
MISVISLRNYYKTLPKAFYISWTIFPASPPITLECMKSRQRRSYILEISGRRVREPRRTCSDVRINSLIALGFQ